MMKTEICNIWTKHDAGEYICIPTNGFVKKSGLAVMGRGLAKQAVDRYSGIAKILGNRILYGGHIVDHIYKGILSFPVKPVAGQCAPDKVNIVPHMRAKFKPYDFVPGWACMADYDMIEHSAFQLMELHDFGMFDKVYLPMVGCGNGGLEWKRVETILERFLGEWATICKLGT